MEDPFIEWNKEWKEFISYIEAKGWVKTSDWTTIGKEFKGCVNVPVYQKDNLTMDLTGNIGGGVYIIGIKQNEEFVTYSKSEFLNKDI